MKKIFFFIGLVLFAGDLMAQPETGQPISAFKVIKRDSVVYLLTAPNQLEKSYDIYFDAVKYSVTLTDASTIKFVQTKDQNFRTKEGFFAGTPYSEIKKQKGHSNVFEFKGWGKFIMLKSGWYAAFDHNTPLVPTSPVLFFFKRHVPQQQE
ncbi:MAG: hypothetical protein H7Y27_15445 [Gemmatimonadaceae bacterium]|nr:hypothetical protein [Chitinophagaceae bacterium]